MKIISSTYEILEYSKLDLIEQAGRTAYLSHDKMKEGSAETFIQSIIDRGHESVIEHSFMSIKIISNIGFTREMNRHRLLAITEQSSRFINLNKDKHNKQITVIQPYWWGDMEDSLARVYWLDAMKTAEREYKALSDIGLPPEAARGVLPLDAKTEVIYSGNFREWRHIIKLRTAKASHPEMRKVMQALLTELKELSPVIFGDL